MYVVNFVLRNIQGTEVRATCLRDGLPETKYLCRAEPGYCIFDLPKVPYLSCQTGQLREVVIYFDAKVGQVRALACLHCNFAFARIPTCVGNFEIHVHPLRSSYPLRDTNLPTTNGRRSESPDRQSPLESLGRDCSCYTAMMITVLRPSLISIWHPSMIRLYPFGYSRHLVAIISERFVRRETSSWLSMPAWYTIPRPSS